MWSMQDKTLIRLCDMEDSHVINSALKIMRSLPNTGSSSVREIEYDNYGQTAIKEAMEGKWCQLTLFLWNSNYRCRGLLGEILRRGLLDRIKKVKPRVWGVWLARQGPRGSTPQIDWLGSSVAIDPKDAAEEVVKTSGKVDWVNFNKNTMTVPGFRQDLSVGEDKILVKELKAN